MKTKTGAVALLLLFLLTGCMGMASTSQPTVLQVVRPGLSSLTGSNQQVVPFTETVRDASAVQRLYTAALSLPQPSRYPLPCPTDAGLIYHLTFLDGASQVQRIDVQPLGCHWVYLSSTDVRQADQGFLVLCATILGLPSLIPAGLLPTS